MKGFHYDAEDDILAVTFTESADQPHTGIELTENIVLYYNPQTQQPLKLIVVSYQAMVRASGRAPLALDVLTSAPASAQAAEFIEEMKRAAVVKWYEAGLISQDKAAEIAGLSRYAFLVLLSRYEVSILQYTPEMLEEELENLQEGHCS